MFAFVYCPSLNRVTDSFFLGLQVVRATIAPAPATLFSKECACLEDFEDNRVVHRVATECEVVHTTCCLCAVAAKRSCDACTVPCEGPLSDHLHMGSKGGGVR